jgi:hypothetical protein
VGVNGSSAPTPHVNFSTLFHLLQTDLISVRQFVGISHSHVGRFGGREVRYGLRNKAHQSGGCKMKVIERCSTFESDAAEI